MRSKELTSVELFGRPYLLVVSIRHGIGSKHNSFLKCCFMMLLDLFCAGVAEWLGGGLQLKSVGGNPHKLVQIRPPAPNYVLVVC